MREWLKRHGEASGFYLAAVLMLLWNLGVNHLWASEDRWAEIAREMWLTGDWFHPAINGLVYFDKPLLSYWPIALLALLTGAINEFIVRLPSALAALLALWATRDLAQRTVGKTAAAYSGWLLLSAYGFLFWGRTAAADMLNLAVVILAVDWFFRRRDKAGFWSYLLFYLICFAGALAKGLPAVILPPVVVFAWMVGDGSWKKHLVWGNFLAAPLALLAALVPFYCAAVLPMPEWYHLPEHGLSGLGLVWRENVVRVFQPFDHDDEGCWTYLIHVPRIMAPWVLALLAALVAAIMGWKKLSRERRWLWVGSLLIFLLFSASGSRRWYYILPIMPFLAIATAGWMAGKERWSELIRRIYWWGFLALGLLALTVAMAGLLWFGMTGRMALLLSWVDAWSVLTIIVLIAAAVMVLRRRRDWTGVLLGGTLGVAAAFCVLIPVVSALRTEKPFVLELKRELAGVPPDRMVFFVKDAPKMVFYMGLERPVRCARTEEALRQNLAELKGQEIYIITENRPKIMDRLKAEIPALDVAAPWRSEKFIPYFEKPTSRKLCCWKYTVPLE